MVKKFYQLLGVVTLHNKLKLTLLMIESLSFVSCCVLIHQLLSIGLSNGKNGEGKSGNGPLSPLHHYAQQQRSLLAGVGGLKRGDCNDNLTSLIEGSGAGSSSSYHQQPAKKSRRSQVVDASGLLLMDSVTADLPESIFAAASFTIRAYKYRANSTEFTSR